MLKYSITNKEDKKSLKIKEELIKRINLKYDDKNPDIVITIGGDGTTLKALHKYESLAEHIVIFGINTGNLGFLTNFTPEEIDCVIDAINNHAFEVEDIGLLSYEIETEHDKMNGLALNEVTLINPPRTLIVDVMVNDIMFEHFRGTGLCVSTPFGSTAYNKSLHGCVVDPSLSAFQLTEIASINSNAYRTLGSPILLANDKVIQINATEQMEVWFTVDNLSYKIIDFKSLTCHYEERYVKFAQNNISFLDRLKKAFINNN